MEEDRLAKWLAETYNKSQHTDEPELSEIIKTVDNMSIDPIDEDRLFEKIKATREAKDTQHKTYTLRWISGIAASIALIFGVNYFFFQQTSITSSGQEIVSHTLPDESVVTLNANSTIDYDSKFNQRVIALNGEAFFEVQKGSSFIVNTKHGDIEVLGTSFNIFSRDSFLIVSCATGKVEVSTKTDSQVLVAGQQTALRANELILESVTPTLIQNWSADETKFSKTSLSIVLSSLSHYYDIRVKNEFIDLAPLEFTGSFLHTDLEKAVKMVLVPFNIKYKIVDQKELILYQ